MSMTECPTREQLASLLLGQTTGHEKEAMESHFSTCDVCVKQAETISARDHLTAAIQLGAVPDLQDASLREAMDRSKTLRPPQPTISEEVLSDSHAQLGELSATEKWSKLTSLKPPGSPDEIGRLGGYSIIEVLGAGGMGVVFRAKDPDLERFVALKAMKNEIRADESAKERFLREARATAAIEHDNIVSIYQVGEEDGVPFIAMPYLRGESLRQRLTNGPLNQYEVVRIGGEIAAGLAAAHERGLIHRDIKPDNIWLEEGTDRVKIVDFGLVRSMTVQGTELTSRGVILGTPKYMSPEQARGESVDARSDLFSLGIVLYQMASGKAPFEAPSVTAMLVKIAESEPVPVETVCPDIHPQLANIIMQLLSKAPEHRPESAEAVHRRLLEIGNQMESEYPSIDSVPANAGFNSLVGRRSKYGITAIVLVVLFAAAFIYPAAVSWLRFESPTGTLVLKIDDENFRTVLQGQTVTIKNVKTGETYRITLDGAATEMPGLEPGSYTFLLESNNGLKTKSTGFEVREDDQTVIAVQWVPKANRTRPTSASPKGEIHPETAVVHATGPGKLRVIGKPNFYYFLLKRDSVSLPTADLGVDHGLTIDEFWGLGARILEVAKDSPAANAGLRAGDLVINMDDKPIKFASQVEDQIAGVKEMEVARFSLVEGEREQAEDSQTFELPAGLYYVLAVDPLYADSIDITKTHAKSKGSWLLMDYQSARDYVIPLAWGVRIEPNQTRDIKINHGLRMIHSQAKFQDELRLVELESNTVISTKAYDGFRKPPFVWTVPVPPGRYSLQWRRNSAKEWYSVTENYQFNGKDMQTIEF